MLSRRKFIGIAGGVGAAGAAGGTAVWSTLLRDHVDEAVDERDEASGAPQPDAAPSTTAASSKGNRVLVVLQLSGGNDGLNTLIPSDGRYRDARTALAIPEAELIAINAAGYSLHPSLAPLAPLWNSGLVTAF